MINPEISVVVPVYNVKKYLGRCVDSILAQTFQNYEILLIDDGATDGSSEICDSYAGQDSRIRAVHKRNGGLSDARNAGIHEASGKYICFIDSDDFIEPSMLQVLYDLVTQNNADLSVCGICDYYEDGSYPQTNEIEQFVLTGREALRYTLEGKKLPGSVCTKLIRADICRDHFFRNGKTYEDAFYTPVLFQKASKVAGTTQSLYNYWHRAGSITSVPFTSKNMDVIEAYQYTLDFVTEHCPELEDVAKFRLFWSHFVVLDKILATEKYKEIPEYDAVLRFLKQNWLQIVKCPYFQKNRRIAAAALKIHVGLYRWLLMRKMKATEVNG